MFRVSIGSFICLCLLGFNVFGQSRTTIQRRNALTVLNNETLEQKINRIASGHGLDPRLFQSLIYAESTFQVKARSNKGAGCLTQLMPATARRFGLRVDNEVDERFSNLDKCLNAGANYLAFLLGIFRGDVRLALAGYNAGEGAVMKFGYRIPPFQETVQYVEKICALYFGESGHGVAMAYNQQLAQIWTNALYRNWRPVIKQTVQIYANQPAKPVTQLALSNRPTPVNAVPDENKARKNNFNTGANQRTCCSFTDAIAHFR